MPEDRIFSIRDLERIKQGVAGLLAVREDPTVVPPGGRYHVMLCFGTGCISSGVRTVKEAFARELAKRNLTEKITLVEIIPGKGSGQLKKHILRFLDRPEIKKLYHRVEKDDKNFGRVFVHFRF